MARRELEQREAVDFDTMIGTGLSGALTVPFLARAMGKHWAIVRKEKDVDNHSGNPIEGSIGERWIFVDDLISSGETRRRVLSVVAQTFSDTKYVGDYLYQRHHFSPAEPKPQVYFGQDLRWRNSATGQFAPKPNSWAPASNWLAAYNIFNLNF